MAKIGITGHARLDGPTSDLVYESLLGTLSEHGTPVLHGVTCLADGADQLFARAILALRGTFDAVLPASDYRSRVTDLDSFDDLLARATNVERMPFRRSGRRAYHAASVHMLQRVELLIAVWDGRPSRNLGDTADVVAAAHRIRLPVIIRWPSGARRLRARPRIRTCRQDTFS